MRTAHAPRRRGFSLVELLVVISILAVLIGILFPVIGAVREGARRAATTSTMSQITQATSQFRADNQRLPGVFSQEVMGRGTNVTQGFTQMENALLELAGGVVANPDTVSDFLLVGPVSNDNEKVPVDLGRIGAADGPQYLTLSDNTLAYDAPNDGRSQQVGSDSTIAMPDVIDAWGYPILMWTKNELAGAAPVFAEKDSDDDSIRAQFYWATNAGFLNSRTVGRRLDSFNQRFSCLGDLDTSDQNITDTMEAILGDPSAPRSNTAPPEPARARGDIILHSTGPDGFWAENQSRRLKSIQYRPTSGGDFAGGLPDDAGTVDKLDDEILGGGG